LRDRAFDSRGHARHRLAIEHVADGGRIDRLAERDRLFDRLEKGRLARVKSLDEKLYAASLARARGLAEDAHRAVEGLSRARPREEIPLLRRAENHDLPTDVRAEIGERGDVARGVAANVRVGGREVKPLGRDEKPVKTDDLDSSIFRAFANRSPALGGDLLDRLGDREGRDLHAVEPESGDPIDRLFDRALENLATEGELRPHGFLAPKKFRK